MMDSTVQTTTPEALEKEDIKIYDLWIHEDQIYLMKKFLKDSDDDPVLALRLYADFMKSKAQHLEKLAEAVNKELSEDALVFINVDFETIDFMGDEDALDRIADMNLIKRY